MVRVRASSRSEKLTSSHSGDLVPGNLRIGGDQSKTFGLRLSDQHAVKGIAVVEWEAGGNLRISKIDSEFDKASLFNTWATRSSEGFQLFQMLA